MIQIDELLKERNVVHASYTTTPPLKRHSSSLKMSSSFKASESDDEEPQTKEEEKSKDQTRKKKWFKLHLKVDRRKPCWLHCVWFPSRITICAIVRFINASTMFPRIRSNSSRTFHPLRLLFFPSSFIWLCSTFGVTTLLLQCYVYILDGTMYHEFLFFS